MNGRIANMGFICALLVVSMHLQHTPEDVTLASGAIYHFFRYVLSPVAVPFFFIVSGYFLARHLDEPSGWQKAVRKRARTLGLPYIVWTLLPFLLFSVFWPVGDAGGICARAQMKMSSIAAAFGCNFFTNPEANRPLWYLRDLMLLVLICPLLDWTLRKSRGWVLLLFAVFLCGTNPGVLDFPGFWISLRWRIFWTFGFSMEGLFYFCVGLFISRNPLTLSRMAGCILGIAGLMLGFVGFALKFNDSPYFGYAVTFAIPLTMACLWTFIPTPRWPSWLVGNAFAVYAMHPIFLRLLYEPRRLFDGVPCACAFEWATAITLALLSAVLLRRFVPRFAAVAFGGR